MGVHLLAIRTEKTLTYVRTIPYYYYLSSSWLPPCIQYEKCVDLIYFKKYTVINLIRHKRKMYTRVSASGPHQNVKRWMLNCACVCFSKLFIINPEHARERTFVRRKDEWSLIYIRKWVCACFFEGIVGRDRNSVLFQSKNERYHHWLPLRYRNKSISCICCVKWNNNFFSSFFVHFTSKNVIKRLFIFITSTSNRESNDTHTSLRLEFFNFRSTFFNFFRLLV